MELTSKGWSWEKRRGYNKDYGDGWDSIFKKSEEDIIIEEYKSSLSKLNITQNQLDIIMIYINQAYRQGVICGLEKLLEVSNE